MNNARRWGLALLVLACSSTSGKQPLEETIRSTHPVVATARLTLRLTDGTVHIYGSDEPAIQITAIKKAYTQERLAAIQVNVTVEGEDATIDTVLPPKAKGLSTADRSGTVDYTLLVPQTCTLTQVTVENGEIAIEGIRGDGVTASLTNGRIRAVNCFAPTTLRLGAGGLDLGYFWWEQRSFPVDVETRNGDIRVALPESSAASFDAATKNGWIRNQFDPEREQEGTAQSMEWILAIDPTSEIKLRAQSGNIRIENIY
jgi:type 1 fimbria pilin